MKREWCYKLVQRDVIIKRTFNSLQLGNVIMLRIERHVSQKVYYIGHNAIRHKGLDVKSIFRLDQIAPFAQIED